ncbi:zinc-finger domain-containing protein [Bacillus tianshenii]|nr:zinc-finger domain-containing protein [Bacillus tianshenii]
MTTTKPSEVRRKAIRLLDTNCIACGIKAQNKELLGQHRAERYCREVCKVGIRLAELGQLIGSEDFQKCAVNQPGINNGSYTVEETFYLKGHLHLIGDGKRYSYEHIAKKLNRSPSSIYGKCEKLHRQTGGCA